MTTATIPITQKQKTAITRMAKETERTRAEVIRDAIDAYLAQAHAKKEGQLKLLRSAWGMWKDRTDLPGFEEMRGSWDRVEA